jgi:hypothetical protein
MPRICPDYWKGITKALQFDTAWNQMALSIIAFGTIVLLVILIFVYSVYNKCT